MFVMITMEGISDLSPMEYLKLVKETNKKDYSKLIENFTRERKIDDQDCAELEGIWEFEGINVTIRELFFIRNNFGCRFRFWAPTVIFESRKVEIENLLNNISYFPRIRNVIFLEFIFATKATSNIRSLQYLADSILVFDRRLNYL
jgi:hypothetical protein